MPAQLFYSAINNARHIVLTLPNSYDGDAVSACFALQNLLSDLQKKHYLLTNGIKIPKKFDFLYQHQKPTPEILAKTDLIITLNTANFQTLQNFTNQIDFSKTPIINIDYQKENSSFGTLNIVNHQASSTSEILYDIITTNPDLQMTEKIATCLLAGMIHQTKRMKSTSLSGQCLEIFYKLIEQGAQKNLIYNNLYRGKTLETLKLWSRVLTKLKTDQQEKLAWVTIQNKDFQETQGSTTDFFNITNELLSLTPTLSFIVFYYSENNIPTALVIANQDQNLLQIFNEKNILATQRFAKIINPQMPQLLESLKQIK